MIICIVIIIIFLIYIYISFRNNIEYFQSCVLTEHVSENVFKSIITDIYIPKTRYDYELSINQFNEIIQANIITNLNGNNDEEIIIDWLNNINELKLHQSGDFEIIKFLKSEFRIDVLIYRESKAYGFHIKIIFDDDIINNVNINGIVVQENIYKMKYSKGNIQKMKDAFKIHTTKKDEYINTIVNENTYDENIHDLIFNIRRKYIDDFYSSFSSSLEGI
jgi:hypothetical protein